MERKNFTTFVNEQELDTMAKRIQTAILVELHNPPQGYAHKYIFGSKAAIYDEIPADVLGLGLRALWDSKLEFDKPLELARATITMMCIRSKKQENPAK